MNQEDYLRILCEEIHSVSIATVDSFHHPRIRIIDIMLYDDKGIYFLTAKGKNFYAELKRDGYVALSGTKNKISVSLEGKVKEIGQERQDEIFKKNPYMQKIYPEGTRDVLSVFVLNEGKGEYFDISDPSHIYRDSFALDKEKVINSNYYIQDNCIGCGLCLSSCPQHCILANTIPYHIDIHHCLSCGRCEKTCPNHAIKRRIEE